MSVNPEIQAPDTESWSAGRESRTAVRLDLFRAVCDPQHTAKRSGTDAKTEIEIERAAFRTYGLVPLRDC